MSIRTASPLIMESRTNTYTYQVIESTRSLTAEVQRLSNTGISQVALVTITLCFDQEDSTGSHPGRAGRSAAYLLDNLRSLVRKTDRVFLLNYTLHFVLPGANQQGGQIVQDRLWDASLWRIHNNTDWEIQHPCAMSIGHSAYPAPYADLDAFVQAAAAAQLHIDWRPEKSSRKAVIQSVQSEPQPNEGLPTLARKLGIPYLSLLPKRLPESLQQLVNPKLAQELHCYPLGRERNMLTVAMLDPCDHAVLDRLHRETGLNIFPVLAHPQELQIALEQLI